MYYARTFRDSLTLMKYLNFVLVKSMQGLSIHQLMVFASQLVMYFFTACFLVACFILRTKGAFVVSCLSMLAE